MTREADDDSRPILREEVYRPRNGLGAVGLTGDYDGAVSELCVVEGGLKGREMAQEVIGGIFTVLEANRDGSPFGEPPWGVGFLDTTILRAITVEYGIDDSKAGPPNPRRGPLRPSLRI